MRISVKHNASISTWYLSFLKWWRSLLNYLMFSNGTVKQQVLSLTILSSIQQLLSLNLCILKFNFSLLQNYGYKFQVNVNCLYQWLVYINKLFITVFISVTCPWLNDFCFSKSKMITFALNLKPHTFWTLHPVDNVTRNWVLGIAG